MSAVGAVGAANSVASRLFVVTSIERDESGIEDKLEQCLALVQSLTQNVSDTEAHDNLTQTVCKGQQFHDDVSLGFLACVLLEPANAPRYYRDLTLVNRDGMQAFIAQLIGVVVERYSKLSEAARSQLFWLTKELIKNSVPTADNIVLNLLRQISGGDVSPKNVWLAENVLDLIMENSLWLEKFPFLLATCVYTYLRLIVDHFSPNFATLRQREIEFCSKTLREKFQECSMIGRDLVRVLQNVARIPEFESLWREFLEKPTTLCPTLTGGIAQLLAMRTPRRFLQSRLTPDMERKLVFLTHNVKLGQQRRYQEWFQRQYLSTPESQSLRCDLIRFICCVIHPSNEILCSDILPRWAVIGWLLMTCLSNVEASNAKLALFYDWLVFDPEKDNIMNIEPAILVMFHSIRPHPQITATLLDFLIRIMREFSKPLSTQIRNGVHTSLRIILEKRVLPSLSPLFDNPKLDSDLRSMIRDHLSEFCTTEKTAIVIDDIPPQPAPIHPVIVDGSPVILKNEAKFSDEEDENSAVFRPIKPEVKAEVKPDIVKLKQEVKLAAKTEEKKIVSNEKSPSPPAIDEFLDSLSEPFKAHMLALQKGKDTELQCGIIEKLMQDVIECDAFDRPLAKQLGACFSHVLHEEFSRNVLPDIVNKETLEDTIGTPLFVLLRNYCQTPTQDLSRQAQLQILVEISGYQPKLSLLLLFYQRVNRVFLNVEMDQSAYKDLVIARNSKQNLEDALKEDLSQCEQGANIKLLCFLVPEIYSQFESAALGHSDLLHLILSVIDASQLQQLCCQCLQGELTLLNQDNFVPLAKASLNWETFEQMAFWSLLQAHRFQSEWLLPLIPVVHFGMHQEACSNIMLILAQQKPTQDLVHSLLSRELKSQDMMVVSLLKHWARLYEDVLAEVLATTVVPQKGNKRKRQTKSQAQQSTQQALLQLDMLRQHSKDTSFFNVEPLQSALQHAQVAASETQKTKFADLFALADNDSEDEYVQTNRSDKGKARSSNGGARRGAGASPQKRGAKKDKEEEGSDTEYDSSTEEETAKPKPPRKRRKQVVSDSD